MAGALLLLAVWPEQAAQLGATVPSVGAGSAFVYELVPTALLMFVIMAVAADTPRHRRRRRDRHRRNGRPRRPFRRPR